MNGYNLYKRKYITAILYLPYRNCNSDTYVSSLIAFIERLEIFGVIVNGISVACGRYVRFKSGIFHCFIIRIVIRITVNIL